MKDEKRYTQTEVDQMLEVARAEERAAIVTRAEEREAIVAWLRERAQEARAESNRAVACGYAQAAADAEDAESLALSEAALCIEAGAHHD